MKRIANYRSGDRAEALGVVLLQLFCAVAAVPRQEDFGLVDAVATLLRREGRFLYAEDSFSVQFKSRTEKVVEYLDKRFEGLLSQELALYIAHVDNSSASIKLYSVGAALAHPNFNDVKGLVLYLEPVQQRIEEDVLHTSLGDPILRWTTAQLADRDFEQNAYTVMKRWLECDRHNRTCRKMGMQTQFKWKTNDIPQYNGETFTSNPLRKKEAIAEVVPAIQMIVQLATIDVSLVEPIFRIMDWMRDEGVEPDPSGLRSLMARTVAGITHLKKVLERHSEADFAVHFMPVRNTPDSLDFWMQPCGRNNSSVDERYQGSLDEIRSLGFHVKVDPVSREITDIGLGEDWLKKHNCKIVGKEGKVFLLKKATNGK